MRVHTRRLTVLALAATFVVAGCSTQATMSKAEVEKQADDIKKRYAAYFKV